MSYLVERALDALDGLETGRRDGHRAGLWQRWLGMPRSAWISSGLKVIAVSDHTGALYDEKGLDRDAAADDEV